jgi:hypothetical protein
MKRAVGKRRLDLNFQKHPNQIEAAKTDAAELTHLLTKRVVIGFADAESLLCRGAGSPVQVHPVHQNAGDLYIRLGHPPFGFGQMPHHLKGGGKKERLALLLVGKKVESAAARLVKHVANQQAQYRAPESAAHHERHGHTNYFTPILHRLPG